MRGTTNDERRAERLQSLTFLGLLADDVSLAVIHFPDADAAEKRALTQLAQWFEPSEPSEQRVSPIRRRRSISDPSELLHEAAALAGRTTSDADEALTLEFLKAPLQKVLDGSAGRDDLEVVGGFAESLSRVTLALANQLANEGGSDDWMQIALGSSIAS